MTDKLKPCPFAAATRVRAWLDADDETHFGQHEKDCRTVTDYILEAADRSAVRALGEQDND